MIIDKIENRLAIICLTRIIDLYQHQILNQINQRQFIISFGMVAQICIFTQILKRIRRLLLKINGWAPIGINGMNPPPPPLQIFIKILLGFEAILCLLF